MHCLPGELPDALLGQRQAFFALGRDRVELAHRAAFALLPRDEVAVSLHPVQHRVDAFQETGGSRDEPARRSSIAHKFPVRLHGAAHAGK